MTCFELNRLMESDGGRVYWHNQLQQRLEKVSIADSARIDLRKLFLFFFLPSGSTRTIEAQGMSVPEANEGELRSWWKATVISITVCSDNPPSAGFGDHRAGLSNSTAMPAETLPQAVMEVPCESPLSDRGVYVKVRFLGYPPEDEETRTIERLRQMRGKAELLEWRRTPRVVGEEVEVSWAVRGHPTAKWEAHVRALAPDGSKIRVRYTGFAAAWDEWVAARSSRLSPRREGAALTDLLRP